jgi:hypothetical protein
VRFQRFSVFFSLSTSGTDGECCGTRCTGGDVSLYSFSDLSLLSSFTAQTKSSCSLFSLSTSLRQTSSSSLPQIHTTLLLACRRRLLSLSWTDGTWNPLVEVSLPHQIRGIAFVDEGRKAVAGFSTGEYGVVTLSSPEGGAIGGKVELGELFSAPFPVPAAEPAKLAGSLRGAASLPGFGAFGGLGNAVGLGGLPGALGKKLEKNGVVEVPKRVGKGKAKSRNGGGKEKDGSEKTDWLWGKEWGWSDDEEAGEGEVLVMRDSASFHFLRSAPSTRSLAFLQTLRSLSPLRANHVRPPAAPHLPS